MCGILGIWSNQFNPDEIKSELKRISMYQTHRGPDNNGFWEDRDNFLFLSHQRLSIIDLSQYGNQPMISKSGRYIISFNGEIYNFQELKFNLERKNNSLKWKGNSDTEVLLALIEEFGLNQALKKCVGMFAFALWDREKKILKLVRDRIGEKPVYYGYLGSDSKKTFIFGSDIASIRNFKYFNNSINPSALFQLINFQAISAPNSIFKNIYQLMPGNYLTVKYSKEGFIFNTEKWYFLEEEIKNARKSPINNIFEAQLEVEKSLKEAIKIQSISDVPLGTFLSGGIDSSLITALLQNQSKNKIKTFTIGFEEEDYNEANFSKEVAKYIGTDHNEKILTAKDAQNVIPYLSSIYSEPFADSSQIPTHLVCREAKLNGLTVALTGDGGDESFGGYNRYFIGGGIWNRLNKIPWPIRTLIGEFGSNIPKLMVENILNKLSLGNYANKFFKLSERLKYIQNDDQFYFSMISLWRDPNFLFTSDFLKKEINYIPSILKSNIDSEFDNDFISRMMIYDTLNYLPNDILTKVDRAAMYTSLETRAPFLDHRVIEIAWRLNSKFKINSSNFNYSGKLILKKILSQYLPKSIIERPKSGFGIPLAKWMRGPLKDWINDLLSKNMISKDEYLNSNEVSKLWQQHLSGKFDNSSKLWPIIMWQSWLSDLKNY